MPAWRGVIADADIAALAAFIVERNSQQGKSAQLPDTFTTNLYDVRIEPILDQGLKQPKSLAVLADGSLLVTEEHGLRLVRDGKLVPEPIAGHSAQRQHRRNRRACDAASAMRRHGSTLLISAAKPAATRSDTLTRWPAGVCATAVGPTTRY